MMETQLVGSEQADAAAVGLRESRLMRSVNSKMRELADTFADSDPILFFCECRTASCYLPIPMSAEEFDALVTEQARWLLREGHEPSVLWHLREPFQAREARSSLGATRAVDRKAPRSIATLRSVSLRFGRRYRSVDDLEAVLSDGAPR